MSYYFKVKKKNDIEIFLIYDSHYSVSTFWHSLMSCKLKVRTNSHTYFTCGLKYV